jgi:hypothetical protein
MTILTELGRLAVTLIGLIIIVAIYYIAMT